MDKFFNNEKQKFTEGFNKEKQNFSKMNDSLKTKAKQMKKIIKKGEVSNEFNKFADEGKQNFNTNFVNPIKTFASDASKDINEKKNFAQREMRKGNDNLGKSFDKRFDLDKGKEILNKGKEKLKNILPPTEEDKFRNELLVLSTKSDIQEYFAQSVSNRLVSEFYKILSELGKSSNNYTELLKDTRFKEKKNSEEISEFFIGLVPDIAQAMGPCANDGDKYNLLADDKITKFLNYAMIIYAEVIRKDFQKLADVIKYCKQLEEQNGFKEKKAEIQKEIEELQNYFKKPFMSGGLFIKGQQIDETNKIELSDKNIIKYKPLINNIVFYTVKKDATTNNITLTNCGSKKEVVDEKEVNEILDSGNCTFVSNQEDPANSCEQMQEKANSIDMSDYFYNEILLKILMNQKAMFSNCLRTKLSPVLDKVLEKLYGFKNETMTPINLTYSDKKYTINTDIEKLIEKLVCKIGIIPITDLEPFMNVVKSSFDQKIAKLQNLLENVEEKKEEETDATKKEVLETKMEEIQTKIGEIENYIKSETKKKKEKDEAEAEAKKKKEKD